MIDQSFRLLGCKYLQGQLEKLEKELAGARTADDVECIHQSRVASRRLRAGMNFFEKCYPAKKTKKWHNQIRKVTKKLGMARDRDVQIEFLKELLSNLDKVQKQYKKGIKRLILRLEQSRHKVQPKVIKSVDNFNSSGVLVDMHNEFEKVLSNPKNVDIPLQSYFVFQQSNERIKKQLEELVSHQDSLRNPLDKDGHHQMRISAKRLRYTLEICNIAFEGELNGIIKAVKKIQTYLGDLHDYDLWQDYLEQFINEEKQKTINYFGHSRSFSSIKKGLDFLKDKCRKRRDILFGEFVEYWQNISEEDLWDKLLSTIDGSLKEYQETSEKNLTV
jgi:CHAD domain-containing protein